MNELDELTSTELNKIQEFIVTNGVWGLDKPLALKLAKEYLELRESITGLQDLINKRDSANDKY